MVFTGIEQQPSIAELADISKRLLGDWEDVARSLGVDDEVIIQIYIDKDNATEQAFQMLISWIQSDTATVVGLCKALVEENRADIAHAVFKVIIVGEAESSV